jgi:hypothetical protein
MAKSERSKQSGTKYESPRAVRLSDAAGAEAQNDCKSGSGNSNYCMMGSRAVGGCLSGSSPLH